MFKCIIKVGAGGRSTMPNPFYQIKSTQKKKCKKMMLVSMQTYHVKLIMYMYSYFTSFSQEVIMINNTTKK